MSFAPGVGDTLTISGAVVTDLLNSLGICGGDCAISGGSLNLASGDELGVLGTIYVFDSGGSVDIYGSTFGASGLMFSANLLSGAAFCISGAPVFSLLRVGLLALLGTGLRKKYQLA